MIKKRWPLLILLLGFARASSQVPATKLTAEEAIIEALANNKELKLAAFDEKIAGAHYKETEVVFLPQAGLSYTAATTNNPLNAFGYKLQQQSITQADFNPDLLNHPGGTADIMARIDVQQPLLNVDQLYMRKGSAKQIEVYRFNSQRTREGLAFEVQKSYIQLQLAYESVAVWKDALETANDLVRYTEDRVGQGLLRRSDALNAKVQVATVETSLAEAKTNVMDLSDYLSLLMGRASGVAYSVENDPGQDTGALVPDTVVPAGRADFAALQKAIEASDLGIRSRKMSRLPRLNAFGSYQLNDSRMFGFGANAYLAGIQLSWDLFKGNSIRRTIATQTLERTKLAEQLLLRKEQSGVELNKAQRQLSDAIYKTHQQEAAIANAAESLRILRDRYEQGLAGSTDVLLAQSQLSQQKLALAQAVFERKVTMAYIHYLTTSSEK